MGVTDRRVQKMNEILSYVKFIKMYAWVKAFSQDVQSTETPVYQSSMLPWKRRCTLTFVFLSGIRCEERRLLELTGYFQSITVGVAAIVVVIASVVTFSTHMLLGYDLTAAQVTYSSTSSS